MEEDFIVVSIPPLVFHGGPLTHGLWQRVVHKKWSKVTLESPRVASKASRGLDPQSRSPEITVPGMDF